MGVATPALHAKACEAMRQRLLMTQRVRQVQRAVVMERQLQQATVPAESAEVGEQISIVAGCLQRETAQ